MAIAFVQKAPNTVAPQETNATSSVLSFDTTPIAGNLVTVCVTQAGTIFDPVSVTDNQGNTYTLAVSMITAPGGGKAWIYYKENIATGSPFTVTVSLSPNITFMDVGLQEWSGLKTSGALGPINSAVGNSNSANPGAINPSGTSALYLGCFGENNNGVVSIAGAFTEIHDEPSSSNAVMGSEYTIGSGSKSMTFALGAVSDWCAVAASFLEAGPVAYQQILEEQLPLITLGLDTAPSGTVMIDFGAWPGSSQASRVVMNQAGILATSKVDAWIHPSTTPEHSIDEHFAEPIRVRAGSIVVGVGFTIHGELLHGKKTTGRYSVAYAWRNP